MKIEGLPFLKMSGAGNDFVMVDARHLPEGCDRGRLAAGVCRRAVSLGGDGLIVVEPVDATTVRMDYYNSDGSSAPFCGNGARCVARFARLTEMTGSALDIAYARGIAHAEVMGERVRVEMERPHSDITVHPAVLSDREITVYRIQVGVPHAVTFVDDLESLDVVRLGREIRRHELSMPGGTNVNFALVRDPHRFEVRSYERGIEDETLASATGCTSSVLVAHSLGLAASPVRCRTWSGIELDLRFETDASGYRDLRMEGDARVVCRGTFTDESIHG